MTRQRWFWIAIAVLTIALVWIVKGILLPFLVGLAVAYLFDPVVDRMQRLGIHRAIGAVLVLLIVGIFVVAVILLIVPIIDAQFAELMKRGPTFINALYSRMLALVERYLSPDDAQRLRDGLNEHAGEVVAWAGQILRGLLTGGMAVFNVLTLLFVAPVVAFYMLRDWDRLVAEVDALLPRAYAPGIRSQARDVDRTLSGFVRGQTAVCLILGSFYAVALSVVGLDFGLTVGLLSGLLTFIPYVGTIFGFVTSVGLAAMQYSDWGMIALVAGIFVLGNVVEGNYLVPKLVGESVGLHAVWVIFALFAGGVVAGFVGMLVALPGAAAIGVLVRHAVSRYKASPLYLGDGARP